MSGDRLDLLARIQDLEEENKTLQRALDKACGCIEEDICINCSLCYFKNECIGIDKCIANNMIKEQWKEWCMKNDSKNLE